MATAEGCISRRRGSGEVLLDIFSLSARPVYYGYMPTLTWKLAQACTRAQTMAGIRTP
jgi:hypothetical protein